MDIQNGREKKTVPERRISRLLYSQAERQSQTQTTAQTDSGQAHAILSDHVASPKKDTQELGGDMLQGLRLGGVCGGVWWCMWCV